MSARFALESPSRPAEKSSAEWSTPPLLFQALDAEFHFTLDACASKSNAKCTLYFDAETDGLHQSWQGHTVWCNPPYTRGIIDRWVKKAWEESLLGATVVMLLPNSTDAGWWHDYVMRTKAEIRFLRGRLQFAGSGSQPRFGSVLAIFRATSPEVAHA